MNNNSNNGQSLSTAGLISATKANPCPHCGKPDWCYSVGSMTVCSREQPPATGWQATGKSDKDGKPYYQLTPEKKATCPAATRHWTYLDCAGNPLVRVVRYDDGAGSKPNWHQESWNSRAGYWEKGTEGIDRANIPVYRYAEVRKAIADNELIFIVEGESCADILWNLGLAATCNIGGSKKWRTTDTKDLEGAKVVIAPDRDKPGIEHAELLNKEFPDALWLYAYPHSQAWHNLPNSQGLDIKDWIDSWKDSCVPIDRTMIMAAVGDKKVLSKAQTVTVPTKSNLDPMDLSSELDAVIAQNLKPSERDLAIAVLASTHKLQVSTLQNVVAKKEFEAEQVEGLDDLGAELIRLTKSSLLGAKPFGILARGNS